MSLTSLRISGSRGSATGRGAGQDGMAHAGDFQDCHGAEIWPGAGRGLKDRKAPKALIPAGRQANSLLVSPAPPFSAIFGSFALQIIVRDNNIDQALKALKKKMQREGIFREMKLRGAYEKPSEKRARERAEAVRRYRKLQRKRLQREGLLAALSGFIGF